MVHISIDTLTNAPMKPHYMQSLKAYYTIATSISTESFIKIPLAVYALLADFYVGGVMSTDGHTDTHTRTKT